MHIVFLFLWTLRCSHAHDVFSIQEQTVDPLYLLPPSSPPPSGNHYSVLCLFLFGLTCSCIWVFVCWFFVLHICPEGQDLLETQSVHNSYNRQKGQGPITELTSETRGWVSIPCSFMNLFHKNAPQGKWSEKKQLVWPSFCETIYIKDKLSYLCVYLYIYGALSSRH